MIYFVIGGIGLQECMFSHTFTTLFACVQYENIHSNIRDLLCPKKSSDFKVQNILETLEVVYIILKLKL